MKILFFTPHTSVWVHTFPELITAEALSQAGNEIVYVTCGSLFPEYCIAMKALGLSFDASAGKKLQICGRCKAYTDTIRKKMPHYKSFDLISKISSEEMETAKRESEDLKIESLVQYTVNSIPLGKISLYEFLLNHKKSSLDFTDKQQGEVRVAFRNTMHSYYASKRILEETKPDAVVIYNTLYSVNHICKKIADQMGIPVYFEHAGENISQRLSKLIFGRGTTLDYRVNLMNSFDIFRDAPSSPESLSGVTDHFAELIRGSHFLAYSSAKSSGWLPDIRKRFAIQPDQKIITATLSSYDERFAAETVDALESLNETLYFPFQVDWVSAVLDYVINKPDLFLIIRVHPREFPNKRDGVLSEHAQKLAALFEKLPPNAAINWPTDGISLYDLAEETDVFLNAWSSVGLEMSLLGLPVVIYSKDLILYPADLNFLGNNKKDYFNKIEDALKSGWSAEKIKQTYRWYDLQFNRGVLDISPHYHFKRISLKEITYSPRYWFWAVRKLLEKKTSWYKNTWTIKKDIAGIGNLREIGDRLVRCINAGFDTLVEPVKKENFVSLENEQSGLQKEVARLYSLMFSGHDSESKLRKNLKEFLGLKLEV